MEDVKDNTQDEFEKILQESIIFFKNENKKALMINDLLKKEKLQQAIDGYIHKLEGISGNGGITKTYRDFQQNKGVHAQKLINDIKHLLSLLDGESYHATNLIEEGTQFEVMVAKYLNLKIDDILTLTTKDFNDMVKVKINQDEIDEFDDNGNKLDLTQFRKKFTDKRQNYNNNKSTRDKIKRLIDALNDKVKIADNILQNIITNKEKKAAAEEIISELNTNIINADLVHIEEAFATAKTSINNIEGLDKKESYYTRIETIKIKGFNLYFERKRKEILQLANNEISKKETIKEIEDVATKATNELQELAKLTKQHGNDATIQTKITDAIATIEESKEKKKLEIYIAENTLLHAHIENETVKISNDVTEKFRNASSQEKIGKFATEAKTQLEALKTADGLSHEIKEKLEIPITIPQEIITKIQEEIEKIEKLKKDALTKYFEGKIKGILQLANNNIEIETTIDGVNTIVINATKELQKLTTQTVDDSIKGSIEKAIEELNKNKDTKIEELNKKIVEDTSKEANNIIDNIPSLLDKKTPEQIRTIAQTNITNIKNIQGLTDETKDGSEKKIKILEKGALTKYFESEIEKIAKLANGKITNKGKIKEIEDVATKATEELQALTTQHGDDATIQTKITDAIAEIGKLKENKKQEIDKEGNTLLNDYIQSKIEEISNDVTEKFRNVSSPSQEAIGNIATEAIRKLQALKKADGLSDIKEKLIDSTTIPGEINTIIEGEIQKIQELEKETLAKYVEEEINNLIDAARIVSKTEINKQKYTTFTIIENLRITVKSKIEKLIDDEAKKKIMEEVSFKKLEDLEKEIMKESKDALIKNAKDVIVEALRDEELKATELKKKDENTIKKAQDELQHLVEKLGEKALLQMRLAGSIKETEEERKIKKEEIIKANAEVAKAALELKEAQDESSKVEAPIMAEAKAKAEAATASKAEAKAKAEAAAAEQVTNYTLARIAHKDEKDKNKLIKASFNYDEFITDINKRLDNIIFLCNKYDFERINMLLKKLIVNHDYVAKNNNPNERKYSDLNSIDELTDKLLKKGEYYGMITYMDKNLNLINVMFDDFWAEYSGKIKQFYEESMSEDIQDINSKIVKILYKLKKLRYGDGKEQDTLPFDFALIADNAIIYKMNSYNFFKKIMKNLHIIQESIPDDANFEEFIAEQRQIFNSKFYRMYEILYRDFQNKLHASLDKIDIIKGRSKNNLSAIIKKLETPVIDDPENIAKAMSYADDLKIPIPDDEVVVPGVKDANITSILARVKSAKDELKTKTEEVSRLKGELSIIDTALLKLKDQNTSNEKERDEIEKEQIEKEKITKSNEQLKEDIKENEIDIDKILKEKCMALMGIDDTTDKKEIELQKEWIKSIQNIEIEDKETFAYIMKAVNNTNAEESPSEQEEKVINRDSSG